MIPYPKIETLFERNENFGVDPTRLRRPVYGCIKEWVVTEKIDGTNMRISTMITGLTEIRGKTDNASIPPGLYDHCTQLAQRVRPTVLKIMEEHDLDVYTLHGEGYGAKIQNGGKYRSDQGFILFDVSVGVDGTFLSDEQVTKTAEDLDIPRVHVLAKKATLEEIVNLVRKGFESVAAEDVRMAEGIVARTVEPLYDNRGERLIIKLKTKDFK